MCVLSRSTSLRQDFNVQDQRKQQMQGFSPTWVLGLPMSPAVKTPSWALPIKLRSWGQRGECQAWVLKQIRGCIRTRHPVLLTCSLVSSPVIVLWRRRTFLLSSRWEEKKTHSKGHSILEGKLSLAQPRGSNGPRSAPLLRAQGWKKGGEKGCHNRGWG